MIFQLTVELFGHGTSTLVKGDIPILVGDRDGGPVMHQVLGNLCIAPEAGVVQRRVAMLINEVHICFVSQQLGGGIKNSDEHYYGSNYSYYILCA